MACGLALKRPLELESLHSPEGVKRQRLSPFRGGASCSPPLGPSASATGATGATASVFGATPRSHLSQEQLESYLKAEIKSLRRRKVLPASRPGKRKAADAFRTAANPCSSGSDSEGEVVPASASASAAAAKPTFTFAQVQQICERLLREQEDRLRVQYDALLYQRLSGTSPPLPPLSLSHPRPPLQSSTRHSSGSRRTRSSGTRWTRRRPPGPEPSPPPPPKCPHRAPLFVSIPNSRLVFIPCRLSRSPRQL